jgi:hypothetical protein
VKKSKACFRAIALFKPHVRARDRRYDCDTTPFGFFNAARLPAAAMLSLCALRHA